jgi:hypothetical protein
MALSPEARLALARTQWVLIMHHLKHEGETFLWSSATTVAGLNLVRIQKRWLGTGGQTTCSMTRIPPAVFLAGSLPLHKPN